MYDYELYNECMEKMKLVGEYIANLGLDAARQQMVEKIDEHKLKAALQSYIEKEQKYYEVCSLAEECDFQGLVEYITGNMMDDLRSRFFSLNKSKRKRAHKDIVSKAVAYSKADTDEAKRRVEKIVSISLEIIRSFYEKKIAYADYVLADHMVSAIKDNTDETVNNAINYIDQAILDSNKQVSEQLSEVCKHIENGSLYSVDNAVEMIRNGQYAEAEKNVQRLFECVSVEHPLYPEYGYNFENGSLKSVPRFPEAKSKYPERFAFKASICAGNHYFDASDNPADYAYRHQQKLVMSISEAIKLLGNQLDPIQKEAQELVGKKIVMVPPAFPPAFPCAVKVKDKTYFDYVLLRTQEILDDGTYIIGNREQTNTSIYFEIHFNLDDPGKENYVINVDNADTRELLNYAEFMKNLMERRELHIYVLSMKKDFIAGNVDRVNYNTGFPSLELEIDFLKRICAIEDYFHVQMNIPAEFGEEECQAVYQLSELVMNEQVEVTWSEASCTAIMGSEFRKRLDDIETTIPNLSYVETYNVNLFGISFEYRHMYTFVSAKMNNVDKIKKLVSILDDGDPFQVTFVPGENNRGFDTLHIPEEMERS